ncbi:MAG: ankyrin repeat domain-containing protein [Rhodothermales bacterium]|nr:ankyrin repeat domain-containing protein [Rhodothermales bacterium]
MGPLNRSLHFHLDWDYPGDDWLRSRLSDPGDVNATEGLFGETPLLIAARRRRVGAVQLLLAAGADPEAVNAQGKTAYAHAVRRGFADVAEVLEAAGASTDIALPDQLAAACSRGDLSEARRLLKEHPAIAHTGNPEEDRLLADLAGRGDSRPVVMLIEAGADVAAKALDGGAALHQACWFGQPRNAQILVNAGAPLDDFDNAHESSPIGWVAHGSRYSGGAAERQEDYVALAEILTSAGCSLQYTGDAGDAYLKRLLEDASRRVGAVIKGAAGEL